MIRGAGILLCARALGQPLGAQVVLDQNQPNGPMLWGGMASWSSQTFQTSAGNVTGAGFLIQSYTSGPQAVTIQLWDQVSSNAGANMLASGTTLANFSYGERSWVDIFWSAVAVTPGSTAYVNVLANGNLITTHAFND